LSSSYAYNSPVYVARTLPPVWQALVGVITVAFALASALIINHAITVADAVLLGIAVFSTAWAATLISDAVSESALSPVRLVNAGIAFLVSVVCLITSTTTDQRTQTFAAGAVVAAASLVWVHSLLSADRSASFEATVGALSLFIATAGLLLLPIGFDSDVATDAAGLLIATLAPLAAALLVTRHHWRALAIVLLLSIGVGILASPPDDLAPRAVAGSLAMLVYIADFRLPARSERAQLSLSRVDAALAVLVAGFLLAYLAVSLDVPIRAFLLASLGVLAAAITAVQRMMIADRELRMRELQAASERIRDQARLDGLTGLPNRAALDIRLAEEVERSVRYRQPLSILFIDIDRFKDINDTMGHQAGDDVLRAIAGIIRDTVRTPDFVARYGGEEFIVIAPATWTADATVLASRIQVAVAERVPRPLGRPVTLSVGISGVPEHAQEPSGLIRVADLALYSAKYAGRDRVEIGFVEAPLPAT
jgi:diguanylate cyclase (GGDEF)-like protein